jgi:hypothetical protein
MTKDEALKLALEALETELAVDMTNGAEVGEAAELMCEAIAAIKQALAAPVQEMTNIERHEQNVQKFLGAQPAPVQEPDYKVTVVDDQHPNGVPLEQWGRPAPDLQAELDATNRQVEILSDALAKSRREVAALKAVQEPVAVMELYASGWDLIESVDLDWLQTLPFGTKLYATPPAAQRQWVGLTDEEIQTAWDSVMDGAVFTRKEVYKAIEAKLKEMNA